MVRWYTTTTLACECFGSRANCRTNARACSPAASCLPARAGRFALYFTGRQHAGENIADVLRQRAAELPSPVQMCDALSRNVPRLPTGVEILLANCLAHGRRQFVEVAANFPDECRYVLEMLGRVYGHDADAHERRLTHQTSGYDFTRRVAGRRWTSCIVGWKRSSPSAKRSRTPGWAKRSRICSGTGGH